MANESRRSFMGFALLGTASLGGVASLVGLKKTWDALPSVASGGFTTVDLSKTKAGKLYTTQWRGKPIFILKQTADMTKDDKRVVEISGNKYAIMIGLCTHLGCIPAYQEDNKKFKCACHGGEFTTSGVQQFGPPPRPLDIPPFAIKGNAIVLGEEGKEYKKMITA